ncbi:DUF1415 domain-containing protein [Accumulibacter sp.]|uniref:DUF1415 domain-containing protein n=1 Tax=Accumulibacter sp. TaxID=2053492 RepID=UPI002CC1C2E6|nr:DUF1415 domain-containing protein [Accumulibacter sp.]HPU80154.1 DUF1415 domain-containing protein [Accumulibacter sp.]
MSRTNPSHDDALNATRHWLEEAVIGLNLCPFAKGVHVKGQVRYVVSDAHDEEALLADLEHELHALLAAAPEEVDTTLLIHPGVLGGFDEFVRFLDLVEVVLNMQRLQGVLQVASFHPDYVFADTDRDDITNCSNRSPYPTLHLLREASLDRAVAAFPDAATIYERNMQTLRALGHNGWRALCPGPSPDESK